MSDNEELPSSARRRVKEFGIIPSFKAGGDEALESEGSLKPEEDFDTPVDTIKPKNPYHEET